MNNQAILVVIKHLLKNHESQIKSLTGVEQNKAEVIVDALKILKEYWEEEKLMKLRSVSDVDVMEVRLTIQATIKDIRKSLRKRLTKTRRNKYSQILKALQFVSDNFSFLVLKDIWEELEQHIKKREREHPQITHFNILLRRSKGPDQIIDHIILNPEML